MNTENNTLGNRIRNLRENQDMTQKELSSMIGLTPKMISFYESNQRTPPLDVLIKLSKIFNVTLDNLVNNKTIELSSNMKKKQMSWEDVLSCFPDAVRVSGEISDLINYYDSLSKTDKRWIMGQMIDVIKKCEDEQLLPKVAE